MIRTEWGNTEQTIVVCTFIDPWTWEEYYDMIQKTRAMYDTINHDAHMILDFTKAKGLPNGALTHLRKAAGQQKMKRGMLVMVGVGSLIQAIISILSGLYPKLAHKVRQVKTLEQAYAVIADIQRVPAAVASGKRRTWLGG